MQDLVVEHGSLMKFCSQAVEALHQRTKFAGLKRSMRHRATASKQIFTRISCMGHLEQQRRPMQRYRRRRPGSPPPSTQRRSYKEWLRHCRTVAACIEACELRYASEPLPDAEPEPLPESEQEVEEEQEDDPFYNIDADIDSDDEDEVEEEEMDAEQPEEEDAPAPPVEPELPVDPLEAREAKRQRFAAASF